MSTMPFLVPIWLVIDEAPSSRRLTVPPFMANTVREYSHRSQILSVYLRMEYSEEKNTSGSIRCSKFSCNAGGYTTREIEGPLMFGCFCGMLMKKSNL